MCRNFTNFPPTDAPVPKRTNTQSWETTGGQTRFGETAEPPDGRRAERGNSRQCWQRNSGHESCWTAPEQRIQRAKRRHRTPTRAAQKERASHAWSCSNPAHDDLPTSKASNCSTAWPVPMWWRHRSPRHTPRERRQVPLAELAWQNSSASNLDVFGDEVKKVTLVFEIEEIAAGPLATPVWARGKRAGHAIGDSRRRGGPIERSGRPSCVFTSGARDRGASSGGEAYLGLAPLSCAGC